MNESCAWPYDPPVAEKTPHWCGHFCPHCRHAWADTGCDDEFEKLDPRCAEETE